MKQRKAKTLLIAGLISIFAVSAHAGTATPAKNAVITIDSKGSHSAITSKTSVAKDDRVTAHKGTAQLSYGDCEQTIQPQHYVIVTSGSTCGTPVLIDGASGAAANGAKVARIDAATAGLPCTNCTAALAKKVAAGKILLVGGALAAAAIIADNNDSSPD